MERKRILLVDDHVDNLELLTIMLGDEYDVLADESAEDALRVVEEFNPDLLVLDVRMHPMNGVQCLNAIRAKPERSSIPAIALTALAREVDKAALFAAGFQAIVTKPLVDQEALQRAIHELLGSCSPTQLPAHVQNVSGWSGRGL
jgi:CheY-like chemotaxis protein